MVGKNKDLHFLGEHNLSECSWVCQDKIFAVLYFGLEHAFPLGERCALSFGEVRGQSGIWDSLFIPFHYGKVSMCLTPQNLKVIL